MAHYPVQPQEVRLDASTICQLRCPSCPTASGEVGKHIGSGFLAYKDFRKFVDTYPAIKLIELSNWGEVSLNPEILPILAYAHEKGVRIAVANGSNLNSFTEEICEGVVRYSVARIRCSIDGASRETYAIYRRNGDFDKVIASIKRINFYKQKYGSPLPVLDWSFIPFGHNEHEIAEARRMAASFNMEFHVKLSWEDLYDRPFSPVKDRELVRKESGTGAADRQEFRQKYQRGYVSVCGQLWVSPQINFDGEMLGCCVNYWGSFGNVFKEGLYEILNGEKMIRARSMLTGKGESRTDVPCGSCKFYREMKKSGIWIIPPGSVAKGT